MSPSWRSRIVIALGPSRLALAVVERGWRPKAKEPAVLQFECANGEAPWQAPVAALDAWLKEAQPKNAEIELVVSDRFARFALIPWSDAVRKQSELAALATIHFETLFGALAAEWDIKVDMSEYAQPGVGCALDKAFIHALRELTVRYKARLASLQPNFIRSYNRWRNRLGNDGIFAVVEPGQCVLASYQKGAWHSLRSVPIQDDIEQSFPILLKREVLMQGLPDNHDTYLHAAKKFSASWLTQNKNATLLDTTENTSVQDKVVSLALKEME